MGYNIGSFKATDTGYTGTIETLTHKITADFTRVLNRTNQNAPAFMAAVKGCVVNGMSLSLNEGP